MPGVFIPTPNSRKTSVFPDYCAKCFIPYRCPVPHLILHKVTVAPQMYFHVASAHRTLWHLTGGNPAVLLFPQHGPDLRLIVIQLLMACLFALEQTVVSLGCKYTLILKTGQPELVVHIGGQDKVVLSFIIPYKSLYSFAAGMSYLL